MLQATFLSISSSEYAPAHLPPLPPEPDEKRDPFFYMRIENIVSRTIQEPPSTIQLTPQDRPLPPITFQDSISPLLPSTQQKSTAIPQEILTFVQDYRKRERRTKQEQIRMAPARPSPFPSSAQVSSNVLNMHFCSEIIEVMKKKSIPNYNICHPQEAQVLFVTHGQEFPFDYLTGHLDGKFFEKKIINGVTSFLFAQE
jgi:hypothetical protein